MSVILSTMLQDTPNVLYTLNNLEGSPNFVNTTNNVECSSNFFNAIINVEAWYTALITSNNVEEVLQMFRLPRVI